jgi:hypothetical protein
LSTEVEHGAHVVSLKGAADVGGGGEVGLDERAALAQALAVEARADEVGPAERYDPLVAGEERLDDCAADQTLRPGYEDGQRLPATAGFSCRRPRPGGS